MIGIVFDIKEFALNDGEGVRTTVFLKGCPLRCIWCHNPEGLSPEPELYLKKNGCLDCGLCRRPCAHSDCRPFGRCLHVCPKNLVTVKGMEWESADLAEKLLKQRDFLNETRGGVTISGGEPLMQSEFLLDLLNRLSGGCHRAIETSGFAAGDVFARVIAECDFVMMDLKLADSDAHRRYTGVTNEPILQNARRLQESGKPHLFRIPLIPGITDTEENLRALAGIAGESRVELLPYNRLAPAKYQSVGRTFTDRIDESRANEPDLSLFANATLRK